MNKKKQKKKNKIFYRTNDQITATEVRLVGEGIETGIYDIARALEVADSMQLDLVEISSKANPPVCKVMNYKKFLFDQKKKKNDQKSKKTVIKELRFTPETGEHDLEFKKRHAIKFLTDGAILKAFVFFRGRMIQHKERGEILLLKLAQDLEDYGTLEGMPVLQGKRMIMIINPKKPDK